MKKINNPPLVPSRPASPDHSAVLWVTVIAIMIALSFAIGWGWNKFVVQPPAPTPAEEAVVEEEAPEPTKVNIPGVLTIDWFKLDEQKPRSTNYSWNAIVFNNVGLTPEDGVGPKAFALGTVRGGAYDGYELQNYIAGLPGLGVEFQNYYLLVSPDGRDPDIVILDNYASVVGSAFSVPVKQTTASELLGEGRLSTLAAHEENSQDMLYETIVLDSGSRVVELEQNDSVKDKDGRTFKSIGVWQRVDYPNEISLEEANETIELENGVALAVFAGADPEITFADNLFYYVRQDGRTVWYTVDLDLGMVENSEADFSDFATGVPQITWNDQTVNTASYFGGVQGGCGTTAGLNIVDIKTIGEIKEAGVTTDGQKVYEPVSYDGEYYTSAFENWKVWTDEEEIEETMENFTAIHPFFYVQDSLERWVEFRISSALPMAECGKPVIYLYPEITTDLDVTLEPRGGFSYTEPVYDNGWRVTASPDGTLVNRDDGRVYPYLFWEGRGGLYVSPNRYWVVKQSSVHDFLVSTLARLGLNTKETADFLEFWKPRMQSATYYKIGFYGTNVMNQLAPLSLSETPDTLIRILMDYQPLEAPIKANPPILPKTPIREGFTVVEWGGVLR